LVTIRFVQELMARTFVQREDDLDPVRPWPRWSSATAANPATLSALGEAVVAAGVLGRAVGHEHDTAGRVDRPSAREELNAVGVDDDPANVT
jgi:hypothetical protein